MWINDKRWFPTIIIRLRYPKNQRKSPCHVKGQGGTTGKRPILLEGRARATVFPSPSSEALRTA